MKRSVRLGLGAFAVGIVAACNSSLGDSSFSKTVLVCEVQQPIEGHADPFVTYPVNLKLTLTVDKYADTLVVGNIHLGSAEILTRSEKGFLEQEITDQNFRRFAISRSTPVPYESAYHLDVISGQLYHESRANGAIMKMFYAQCQRANQPLF
jgi:hypothetical protein